MKCFLWKRLCAPGAIFLSALASPASAQLDMSLPWLDNASIIARCEVREISHSLLLSDVRRVESGAPAPMIPYRVTLDLLQAHPHRPLTRLRLESIVATIWMPAEKDRGIIALQGQGREYFPSGIFPTEGYFPEQNVDGATVIEFPANSGNKAPSEWVWECLCDLMDSRSGKSLATQEKWMQRLRESGISGSVVALQYLLRVPGTEAGWEKVIANLCAMIQEVKTKPELAAPLANYILKPLARQAGEEQAAMAHNALMEYVSTPETPARTWPAEVLVELACRKPSGERIEALNTLLNFEFAGSTENRRLVSSITTLAPAFRNNSGDDIRALQEKMLRTPAEFAILLSAHELAMLWELLAEIRHPVLRDYLEGFLKSPTPAYLGISAAPSALESLRQTATRIIATYSREQGL